MARKQKGTTYMMGEGTEQGLVFRGRQLEERGFGFSGLAILVVLVMLLFAVAGVG